MVKVKLLNSYKKHHCLIEVKMDNYTIMRLIIVTLEGRDSINDRNSRNLIKKLPNSWDRNNLRVVESN